MLSLTKASRNKNIQGTLNNKSMDLLPGGPRGSSGPTLHMWGSAPTLPYPSCPHKKSERAKKKFRSDVTLILSIKNY